MNELAIFLNDSETFSSIRGAFVVELDAAGTSQLLEGEHINDITPLKTYDLTNPVHLRMLADHIEKNR